MIRLELHSGIGRLILDRPQARNAVPPSEWERIAEEAERAVANGAQALVLAGAGGAFCAGADLGDFPAIRSEEEGSPRFRAAMRRGIDGLVALPIPVIAWIDGPCYGAGVALAMACDLRVAAVGARFAITPAKMGISYPQEDVARLVRLAGPGQAARLLFTGAPIDAEEAARIGLVELVGDAAAVDALVATMLANGGESLRVLKRGIGLAAAGKSADAGQDAAFDALIGSEEFGRRLEAARRK